MASDAGRLLAAQRQPKTRTCLVCGKQFVTIGRGKYCSLQHAKYAWFAKNRKKTERTRTRAALAGEDSSP